MLADFVLHSRPARFARLVIFSALFLAGVPAIFGQANLAKLGDSFGSFRRMKGGVVESSQYSFLLFDNGIKVLDQNAQEVGTIDLFKGRALAVGGELLYVVAAKTADESVKVMKLRFTPGNRKLAYVGEPAEFPTQIGSTEPSTNAIDMCATTDGKVWVMVAWSSDDLGAGGQNLIRYSTGEPGDKMKRDLIKADVPATYRNKDYYVIGHTWTGLINLGGKSSESDPVRLEADGPTFWFAISDQADTHIRVGQVRRKVKMKDGKEEVGTDGRVVYEEGTLEVDKMHADSGVDGGVPVWFKGDGEQVNPIVTDLAVDSEHVYLSGFAGGVKNFERGAQSESYIFRFPKNYSGKKHPATVTKRDASFPVEKLTVTRKQGTNDSGKRVRISDLVHGAGGALYASGVFGAETTLEFKDPTGTVVNTLPHLGRSNLFVARVEKSFKWALNGVERHPEAVGSPQPLFEFEDYYPKHALPQLSLGNSAASTLILASRILEGEARFDTLPTTYSGKNSFGLLLSSSSLKPTKQQFVLTIAADGKQPNNPVATVPLNLADIGITPGFGKIPYEANEQVTVTMPSYVYQKADGSFLNLTGQSAAQIEQLIQAPDVVARFRPENYTMTREGDPQTVTGTGKGLTVTMTRNTTVTFHFIREYALTISSDLANLPGVDPASGQALGNPDPPAKKNWIEENAQLIPQVDGQLNSSIDPGTRFLLTGYTSTGAVGTGTVAFTGTQGRQQVRQFTMSNSATITYQWKAQHSITVSTSASKSAGLPGIKSGARVETGSGVFWLDRGAEMIVGASDNTAASDSMTGVLSGTGALEAMNGLQRLQFSDSFTHLNRPYLGRRIASLTRAGTVSWNYGATIFRQIVPIGTPVAMVAGAVVGEGAIAPFADTFPASDVLTEAARLRIDFNRPPTVVSVLNAPAGTTPDQMMVWSIESKKAHPIRPGRFLIEWPVKDNGVAVVTEITSGFSGDIIHDLPTLAARGATFRGPPVRHLRSVLHAAMPPIELDPSTTDDTAFKQLSFSAGFDPLFDSVNGTNRPSNSLKAPTVPPLLLGSSLRFPVGPALAEGEGRHILVFTKKAGGGAVGNLSREPVVVRVLETRRWNARNDWDVVGKQLRPAGGAAEIGARLTSAIYDTAQIGTGFLTGATARYNSDLYNRSLPPTLAGPIFPVNAVHTLAEEDQLNVVWYERVDGVLWPYRPVHYRAQWPNAPHRIVIASQLGSDGAPEAHSTTPLGDLASGARHLIVKQTAAGGASTFAQVADYDRDELGAEKAFDGVTGTDIHLNSNANVGWVISRDAPSIVTGIQFAAGSVDPLNDPVTFTFEGSNGSVIEGPWTLVRAEGPTGLQADIARSGNGTRIDFPNTTAYLHYRVLITSNRGDRTRTSVDELRLFGVRVPVKFDPASTADVRLYNQPNPALPGFNPNEEHALIGNSAKYGAEQPQPLAAYALRDDLNVTTASGNYTSDPAVLVQYTDTATGQPAMAVYAVQRLDPAIGAFGAGEMTYTQAIKAGDVTIEPARSCLRPSNRSLPRKRSRCGSPRVP